jgi:hypothetical protein
MKFDILRKLTIVLIILTPLVTDMGCKKQKRCGCGKDVIQEITDGFVYVYYDTSTKSAYFYPESLDGSTYWFCNPGKWIDTLIKYTSGTSGKEMLVSGKAYYECNYLMNAGNYGYYVPPVYQVDVTDVKKNNYGKK